jgi:hypothetical protein
MLTHTGNANNTHMSLYVCRQNQEQQEQLQVLSRYLLKLGLQGLALPPAVAAIVQGTALEQCRQHAALVHASDCKESVDTTHQPTRMIRTRLKALHRRLSATIVTLQQT